jgi:ATP-dependent DNA helicase PIF1
MVHKSQGLTLDRAVLDLRCREFASGQTYVAISRVRNLKDLLFETPFDVDYFHVRATVVRTMRDADIERRRLQQPLPSPRQCR